MGKKGVSQNTISTITLLAELQAGAPYPVSGAICNHGRKSKGEIKTKGKTLQGYRSLGSLCLFLLFHQDLTLIPSSSQNPREIKMYTCEIIRLNSVLAFLSASFYGCSYQGLNSACFFHSNCYHCKLLKKSYKNPGSCAYQSL